VSWVLASITAPKDRNVEWLVECSDANYGNYRENGDETGNGSGTGI